MKSYLYLLTSLLLVCFLSSCGNSNQTSQSNLQQKEINPPAKGFNLTGSDQKAIKLADEVMIALGGREAYDKTEFLSWNFFGSRLHVWQKNTGDIYIDNKRDKYELWMNINDMTGKMRRDGENISNQDTLSKYIAKGKKQWINDAYWLVMPYKLKDSGVTLKYLGETTTEEGAQAEKLELTFADVGVTPENKYHVYVDSKTKLVTQWDFFNNYEDQEPEFSTPWNDYNSYGAIKLSGNRGKGSLTEISVSDTLSRILLKAGSF